MPLPIALPIRQEIVRRHKQGQSLGRIARDLKLSYNTVRALWRRGRGSGPDALASRYHHRGRPARPDSRRSTRAACWFKRRHPSWGAGLIRVLLQERWPDQTIPSTRTLQRAFRAAGWSRPRRRSPPVVRHRGAAPHAVWQMDAVDGARLADGAAACWLTVSDEHSGAILLARLFPPRERELGAARRGPGRAAGLLHPVGPAGTAASGQRAPVGLVERPAA